MKTKIICFVFGGYSDIKGTYYYSKNQEKTGYITTDIKSVSLLSDEDITEYYNKLDKELLCLLDTIIIKDEQGLYMSKISSNAVVPCKDGLISNLIIDTVQKKLEELKAESKYELDCEDWDKKYSKELFEVIKINNYFSEVIDINNIGNSKNSILSMIKTSHV